MKYGINALNARPYLSGVTDIVMVPTMAKYYLYLMIFFCVTKWSECTTAVPETEVQTTSDTVATTTGVDELYSTEWATVSDNNTVSWSSTGEEYTTVIMPPGNATDGATSVSPKSAGFDPYAIMDHGMVSKKQYETCSLVVNIALKPIVCIAGIVMNSIGVCILLQKRFRRSTYTYLCYLALSDICILLGSIIGTIPKIVNFYDDVIANYIHLHIFPYNNMFWESSFTRISEYIICALAIERFVAVLQPLKVKDLFLCRHALGICIGISIFCILFHIHFTFSYYPKPYFNPSRNITMYALGRKSWYTDSGVKTVYDFAYEIIFLYLPVLILVFCNIGILIRINQMNKERQNIIANDGKNDKFNKEQLKITVTLLIISLTFMLVFVPLVALTVVQKFNKDIKGYGREHYFLYLMIDVVSLGWNMSSANDFIIYIYTSKQFKQALVDMFCKKIGMKRQTKTQTAYSFDSRNMTSVTEASTLATENHM